MQDEELKYSTYPNVFLVAESKESGRVLGFVAYSQMTSDIVELNRLSVHQDFRGLKIGEKLVTRLIEIAKCNGYNTMYLDTSEPQIAGRRLYEKLGFEHLRFMPMMVYGIEIGVICGLKDVAFIKRL